MAPSCVCRNTVGGTQHRFFCDNCVQAAYRGAIVADIKFLAVFHALPSIALGRTFTVFNVFTVWPAQFIDLNVGSAVPNFKTGSQVNRYSFTCVSFAVPNNWQAGWIWAGLFSAVVATLIGLSIQALQPDYAQATVVVLLELVALQRAIASGNAAVDVPTSSFTLDTPISPSALDRWVNGLWFTRGPEERACLADIVMKTARQLCVKIAAKKLNTATAQFIIRLYISTFSRGVEPFTLKDAEVCLRIVAPIPTSWYLNADHVRLRAVDIDCEMLRLWTSFLENSLAVLPRQSAVPEEMRRLTRASDDPTRSSMVESLHNMLCQEANITSSFVFPWFQPSFET
ncbi:hypothetical protein BDV98DRAFT_595016 [Pterulicium gracile]|uniref:DUF6535 domain-containing protein n=1 Tax=Pterulicium gracile TaxID=1884261 RepID=A0A5C3QGP8_9AGAR|nr:hypothetical protein BDV98DRAFT_595016 [Pterula gracilis]